jgi:chemotaxis protein CheD
MTISTILGSCVAACLYDPVKKVIGMNHFMLAKNNIHGTKDKFTNSELGNYGLHAMDLLINSMITLGVQRKNLCAKVFGGGNVLPYFEVNSAYGLTKVGEQNSQFILTYLKQQEIRIVAKGLGGNFGRVIHFRSSDYSVLVKRIPLQNSHIYGMKS